MACAAIARPLTAPLLLTRWYRLVLDRDPADPTEATEPVLKGWGRSGCEQSKPSCLARQGLP